MRTETSFFSRINEVTLTSVGTVRKVAGRNFWRGFRFYRTAWMIAREVQFLKQLEKYDFFPKVLDQGNKWFEMTYGGEILNAQNCPEDTAKQLETIADILEREGITHRDIKLTNLVVLNGKIRLIDFSWAIRNDEKPFKCPSEFSGTYRREMVFNNRVALNACLNELGRA